MEYFRQAKALAPDNAYTISVSYIGEVMRVFAKDEANKKQVIDTLNNNHTVTWQINGRVEMENGQILGNAATLREAILKCLYFIANNGGTYTGYDY